MQSEIIVENVPTFHFSFTASLDDVSRMVEAIERINVMDAPYDHPIRELDRAMTTAISRAFEES